MKQSKKKYWLLILILVFNLNNLFTQDFFDEFESLIEVEKPVLLPERMIFTQRMLWGEKGLFRKTGISNLSICLLYTSPSPRDLSTSRMPSSA